MIKKIVPFIIVIAVLSSFAIPIIYFKAENDSKIGNTTTITVGEGSTIQDELDVLAYQLNLAEIVEILSSSLGAQPANNIPITEKSPEEILMLVEQEIEILMDLGVKIHSDFTLNEEPLAMITTGDKRKVLVWSFSYTLDTNEEFVVVYSSSVGKILYLETRFANYSLKEQADLTVKIGGYYTNVGDWKSEIQTYQSDNESTIILNEDVAVILNFVDQKQFSMVTMHPDYVKNSQNPMPTTMYTPNS